MNALEKAEVMRDRTKQFAIRVVAVVRSLRRSREGDVVGKQLCDPEPRWLRTIEPSRSRSKAEFISRIAIVVEEADETVFWLELLADTGMVAKEKLSLLLKEANGLLAICAASLRTAKYNK